MAVLTCDAVLIYRINHINNTDEEGCRNGSISRNEVPVFIESVPGLTMNEIKR